MPAVYRVLSHIRGSRIHFPEVSIRTDAFGGNPRNEDYGLWMVPTGILNSGSVVYSAGVGNDITFDLALIDRFKCRVFAFDPSPEVEAFVQGVRPPENFVFRRIGLSDTDGTVSFAPQATKGHYQVGSEGGENNVSLPVRRIATLARELGHSRIDLLKMDIEGFEYSVVADLFRSDGPKPNCLLIEFHHPWQGRRDLTRQAVTDIRGAGYRCFWVSDYGSDYGFIRD